jgi:hypothetical protein
VNEPYDVKTLSRGIFKNEHVPVVPWPRMILCAIATLSPILVGIYKDELPVAIFGALSGFLVALNDHLGSLRHRLWVTTVSAFILTVAFALGFYLRGEPIAYAIVVGLISYWIGLLGGEGAELERAILFALIGFITAYTTPGLTADFLQVMGLYAFIAYVCLMVGGPAVFFLGRHKRAETFERLRHSLRRTLTRQYEKHTHAVVFVVTVLFSVWFSRHLEIGHGSWVTVTVLIVLRPDRRMTIYKTLQRFLGTFAGVLAADLVLMSHPALFILIAMMTLCAFVIPWAILRNYGLTSFFITLFVVFILEIAVHDGGTQMATLRLAATFVGCLLSLAGVGLARVTDRILMLF